MKKGLRVLLCLFFSIFSLIMCISFNLNTTKENLENSQANILGYVEPKNDLVIKNKVNIEVNTKLPNIKEYFTKYNLNDTGVIKYYINDKEINKKDVISNVNTYKVLIIVNKNKYNTELNVIDTKSPKLTTKNITIYENEKYNINSFVTSCKDNSNKKCNISFADKKMANYTKSGTYKISISAIMYVTLKTSSSSSPSSEFLKGDVNGDGKVNITDVALINAHVKKTKLLTGEEFS